MLHLERRQCFRRTYTRTWAKILRTFEVVVYLPDGQIWLRIAEYSAPAAAQMPPVLNESPQQLFSSGSSERTYFAINRVNGAFGGLRYLENRLRAVLLGHAKVQPCPRDRDQMPVGICRQARDLRLSQIFVHVPTSFRSFST